MGITYECQWNDGSGGPGEGLGLPLLRTFLALDRIGVPLEKKRCLSLGKAICFWIRWSFRLVAASVSNYTGSGAT